MLSVFIHLHEVTTWRYLQLPPCKWEFFLIPPYIIQKKISSSFQICQSIKEEKSSWKFFSGYPEEERAWKPSPCLLSCRGRCQRSQASNFPLQNSWLFFSKPVLFLGTRLPVSRPCLPKGAGRFDALVRLGMVTPRLPILLPSIVSTIFRAYRPEC